MAATTSNANRQVVSDAAADGILLGWYEAKYAQNLSEIEGWWDTPRGHAAEAAMGYLMMALEAMGFDMSKDLGYSAWLADQERA